MEERQLFDRDKLLQQLHSVQNEQPIHEVHNEQPATVYGAEREALERAAAAGLEASKRAAAATVASEQGRSAILKGLAAGADIYALFAIACDTISKTTGDTVFRDQAGELLRVIYGRALGETPLQVEREEAQNRADRLRAYLKSHPATDPNRKTVYAAFKGVMQTLAELDSLIRS